MRQLCGSLFCGSWQTVRGEVTKMKEEQLLRRVVLFLSVVLLCCCFASTSKTTSSSVASAISQANDQAPTTTREKEEELNRLYRRRVSSFFHRFDVNGDRKLSVEEAQQHGQELISAVLPGVTYDDFLSFMQIADTNKDGTLDHREFISALNKGLEEGTPLVTPPVGPPSFLQLQDTVTKPPPEMPQGAGQWLNMPKPGQEGNPETVDPPVRGEGSPHRQANRVQTEAEADEERKRLEFEEKWVEKHLNGKWKGSESSGSSTTGSSSSSSKSSSSSTAGSSSSSSGSNYRPPLPQEQRVKAFIDKSQDGCIICQYAVERIEDNVHWAGIIPQFRGGRLSREKRDTPELDHRYQTVDELEMRARRRKEEQIQPLPREHEPSLLEISSSASTDINLQAASKAQTVSRAAANQFPYFTPYVAGASQLNTPFVPFAPGQPGFRSYSNAIERQRFSEVYHVCDLTLDHICEAGMPNAFYKHCAQLFQAEGAIANLVSRQFSVIPVCQRLQFCDPSSYVHRAIHNPEEPKHSFHKKDLLGDEDVV